MRAFTKKLIGVGFILLLFPTAKAQQTTQTATLPGVRQGLGMQANQAATVANMQQAGTTASNKKSSKVAMEYIKQASASAGVDGRTMSQMRQVAMQIGSAQSAKDLAARLGMVNQAVSMCEDYTQQSKRCCQTPDSCQRGMNIKQIVSMMAVFAPLLAGEKAACVAAASQALMSAYQGMGLSKGVSKACEALRYGGSDGQQQVPGCSAVCQGAKSVARALQTRAAALMATNPQDQTALMQIQERAMEFGRASTKAGGQCISDLAAGEKRAQQQTQALQQSAQQSGMAIEACKAEEEVPEEELPPECSDPGFKQQNPLACGAQGNLGENNGPSGKLTPEAIPGGALAEGALDGESDNDSVAGTNGIPGVSGKSTNGNGSGGGGFFGGGGGGAGAGAGGNSGKAGGRRGVASGDEDSLIMGYGKDQGGAGSGASKRSGQKGFKLPKLKNPFGKNKNKGKALSALAKLAQAGISPSIAGSIFARVTNRFVSSTVKIKGMYDCKPNKKLWMKK